MSRWDPGQAAAPQLATVPAGLGHSLRPVCSCPPAPPVWLTHSRASFFPLMLISVHCGPHPVHGWGMAVTRGPSWWMARGGCLLLFLSSGLTGQALHCASSVTDVDPDTGEPRRAWRWPNSVGREGQRVIPIQCCGDRGRKNRGPMVFRKGVLPAGGGRRRKWPQRAWNSQEAREQQEGREGG